MAEHPTQLRRWSAGHGRRWPRRGPVVLALALIAGFACDRSDDDPARRPPVDTVRTPAPDTATPPPVADGRSVPFDTSVIVYFEAGSAAIDSAGASMDAEAVSVMADDLMFYRASTLSVLERQPVRLVRIEGRRPLRFVVDGEPRWYDFADRRPLDLVVLYRPGDEPRVVSPVDVSAEPGMVSRFFAPAPAP